MLRTPTINAHNLRTGFKIFLGIVVAANFAIVVLSIPPFLKEIEREESGQWRELSMCRDDRRLLIRAGMTKREIARLFPGVKGYRIRKIIIPLVQSKDPRVYGSIASPVREEWNVTKEGYSEHIVITFDSAERVVDAGCGNC